MINESCSTIVSFSALFSVFIAPNNVNATMFICAIGIKFCTKHIIFLLKFCSNYPIGTGNAFLCKAFKILLAVRRPYKSSKTTYGMPSSHAQSLFYFVGYLSASSLYRRDNILSTVFIFSSTSIYSITVCYCRVEIDRDHTWPQVGVGLLIGLCIGAVSRYKMVHIFDTLTKSYFVI